MRQSHTAVVARNERWSGDVETEPFEVAWAGEAIWFVRVLEPPVGPPGGTFHVQVSPDGMHWCDEGSTLELPSDPAVPNFVRVRRFGGWLRLAGTLPDGAQATVIAYLVLKS